MHIYICIPQYTDLIIFAAIINPHQPAENLSARSSPVLLASCMFEPSLGDVVSWGEAPRHSD